MSRNGAGTYSLPAGNPVSTGTTISSTWANNTLSDIATAMTQSLSQDGQTPVTANLPMTGFKHTGAADANAAGQYLVYGQSTAASLGGNLSVGGTLASTGAATLSSTLAVTGASTLTGAVTAGSTVTATGAVTGSALIPSGASVPTNGTYLLSANTLGWSTASTYRMQLDANGLGIGAAAPGSGRMLAVGNSTSPVYLRTTTTTTAGAAYNEFLVTSFDSAFLGLNNTGAGGAAGIPTGYLGLHTAASPLSLGTNGTSWATINTAGVVNLIAGSGSLRTNGHISRFESSELTPPTTPGATTAAHGGTRVPDVIQVRLRCKTAELGYSIGDEVAWDSDIDGSTTQAVQSYGNATNVGVVYSRTGNPDVRNATTGALATITLANWKLVFKCLWL